jgi:hypothetical protein
MPPSGKRAYTVVDSVDRLDQVGVHFAVHDFRHVGRPPRVTRQLGQHLRAKRGLTAGSTSFGGGGGGGGGEGRRANKRGRGFVALHQFQTSRPKWRYTSPAEESLVS